MSGLIDSYVSFSIPFSNFNEVFWKDNVEIVFAIGFVVLSEAFD